MRRRTDSTEYPLRKTHVRSRNKYNSLHQCLIALGAQERDVYAHQRDDYRVHKGPGDKAHKIWELGEDSLMNWVHEMYLYSVKIYRDDEEALKELNVARDRAKHIIYYHFHPFERR